MVIRRVVPFQRIRNLPDRVANTTEPPEDLMVHEADTPKTTAFHVLECFGGPSGIIIYTFRTSRSLGRRRCGTRVFHSRDISEIWLAPFVV